MKSKIMIDLDYDNRPVVRIEYVPSDDVRDKMVKRFIETLGSESYMAACHFLGSSAVPTSDICLIRPLTITEISTYGEQFRRSEYLGQLKDPAQPSTNPVLE